MLRDLRTKYLEDLEKLTGGPLRARLDLAVLADVILRCVLSRPWPSHHQGLVIHSATGKYSKAKVHELCCKWASWIEGVWLGMNAWEAESLRYTRCLRRHQACWLGSACAWTPASGGLQTC